MKKAGYYLCLLLGMVVLFTQCEKDELAPLSKVALTRNDITAVYTTASASVEYSYPATLQGIKMWVSTSPDMSNERFFDGAVDNNKFTVSLFELSSNTTYYYEYEYWNGFNTARSEMGQFKTLQTSFPAVTTNNVTNITMTTATTGGNITSDGGLTVTARGVCWSTSQSPTTANTHTSNGSGTGSFTSSLTGLTKGTTYYVRAYATNANGTVYGAQKSFTTISGTWQNMAYFTGAARIFSFSFSVNNKGYVGGGQSSTWLYDFWEYNPASNTWTQKADVPTYTSFDKGFSANGKGYLLTYSTLYEYNTSYNTWTAKTGMPSNINGSNAAVGIGTTAYIGLQYHNSGDAGIDKYFYQYNPSSNTYTQKSLFGGLARSNVVTFYVSGKVYAGGGFLYSADKSSALRKMRQLKETKLTSQERESLRLKMKNFALNASNSSTTNLFDLWEYNPSNNSWTQKANIPIVTIATGFAIGTKGYCIGQNNGKTYEYNPTNNAWTQVASYPGGYFYDEQVFVIGNNAYMLGYNTSSFYRFTPQ